MGEQNQLTPFKQFLCLSITQFEGATYSLPGLNNTPFKKKKKKGDIP